MIELGGLATRPSRQGRGLGSALVKAVTDLVRNSRCHALETHSKLDLFSIAAG